jgi:hypothetical protein
MNNFNKVFLVVKRECEKQKHIAEITSIDLIAKETSIPVHKLSQYLDHLQQIGVIRYSIADKYIHLTTLGRKKDTVLTETSATGPMSEN